MKLKLNIKGVKQTIGEMAKYDKAVDRLVDIKVEKFANKIRNEAIDLVPVDESTLQGSIQIIRDEKKAKSVGVDKTTEVKNALEYAAYIEFGQPVGTGPHGGPRPYLRPAAEKFRKAFSQELKDAIRKV